VAPALRLSCRQPRRLPDALLRPGRSDTKPRRRTDGEGWWRVRAAPASAALPAVAAGQDQPPAPGAMRHVWPVGVVPPRPPAEHADCRLLPTERARKDDR